MLPVSMSHPIQLQGLFGATRKHDVHTGLDLYAEDGSLVTCIKGGVIKEVFQFTGETVGTPWWEDTYAVLVSSESIEILYGEVYNPRLRKDSTVGLGDVIGKVKRVLKVDKGVTPVSMLHLEVWEKDTFSRDVIWGKDEERPEGLLNPLWYLGTEGFDYWIIKRESGYVIQDCIGETIKYFPSAVDCKAYCMFHLTGTKKYLTLNSTPEDKLAYFKQTNKLLIKELF
jgi:hypothetical protein